MTRDKLQEMQDFATRAFNAGSRSGDVDRAINAATAAATIELALMNLKWAGRRS